MVVFGSVADQAGAGDLPKKEYGGGNGLLCRVGSRRRPRVAGGIYQPESLSAFRGGEYFELTCHGFYSISPLVGSDDQGNPGAGFVP
jgi:hypothetical protein